ncbi:IucA/IucC family C-terminal-domain containing protein [Paenibacillus abyssi]|uniref:Ferric siderophore reductase C-terminal domain-containing protein n=1 Tax=Paenibacillus abyssi TaxID=1340531 RepID=A0A917D5U7_9BACL|nr:IucA/IucC family C-terminal-domain containing protein [Paenibacillus abyssi]GGG11456.1 hypothetical protein GCM10010916_30380 [Paenibacillus abyssi]
MATFDFLYLEEKFNIVRSDREEIIFAMSMASLLEEENAQQFLAVYAPLIKTTDLDAAAAYFAGYLGAAAASLQYSLSVWDAMFDLSCENVIVQLHRAGEYFRLAFKLINDTVEFAPRDSEERLKWREQRLTTYYHDSVSPLFQVFARCAGVDVKMLWGQLPTRFNYYMEIWMSELENAAPKSRLEADYRYLREDLAAAVFGCKKNPFEVKIRWIESLNEPGRQMRMKNACCLYYKTEGGQYCYSCPRLKEEDREARRALVRV